VAEDTLEFSVCAVLVLLDFMPLDPFEGRIQFLDQIRHLTASQSASIKLCQFALKHRNLHEDLYSCIVEELPATSLNDKVNIFYFLGTLVEQSEKAQFRPYGDMVRRDLERIVADVAPLDGGAANIPPARKVSFCFRIGLISGVKGSIGQGIDFRKSLCICVIDTQCPRLQVKLSHSRH
jgi:CTD kinase subunit gamma CTK3